MAEIQDFSWLEESRHVEIFLASCEPDWSVSTGFQLDRQMESRKRQALSQALSKPMNFVDNIYLFGAIILLIYYFRLLYAPNSFLLLMYSLTQIWCCLFLGFFAAIVKTAPKLAQIKVVHAAPTTMSSSIFDYLDHIKGQVGSGQIWQAFLLTFFGAFSWLSSMTQAGCKLAASCRLVTKLAQSLGIELSSELDS